MRTWILLADAVSARLYESRGGRSDWALLREFSHPESRALEQDLVSDKPGRVKQSTGKRAALEPRTRRHKVEMDKFARELAKALEALVDAAAPDRIVLVTPPTFLGLLRGHLAPRVEARIASVVEKDYLHLEPPELKERLHEQL